jgi:hypothetical protein
MGRYGYSIFCDDIRNEVGGKLTFVGCYNAVMFVSSGFPLDLPKFCIHIHILSPVSRPYLSIETRCYVPGEVEPVFQGAITPPEVEHQIELVPDIQGNFSAPRYIAATASIILSPLRIRSPGLIRVRAALDGETDELNLGSLRIVEVGDEMAQI